MVLQLARQKIKVVQRVSSCMSQVYANINGKKGGRGAHARDQDRESAHAHERKRASEIARKSARNERNACLCKIDILTKSTAFL